MARRIFIICEVCLDKGYKREFGEELGEFVQVQRVVDKNYRGATFNIISPLGLLLQCHHCQNIVYSKEPKPEEFLKYLSALLYTGRITKLDVITKLDEVTQTADELINSQIYNQGTLGTN